MKHKDVNEFKKSVSERNNNEIEQTKERFKRYFYLIKH